MVVALLLVPFTAGLLAFWLPSHRLRRLLLVAVAAIYLIGRSPFRVQLTIPHRRVVMGDPAVGRIEVLNPHRRRTLGVKVEVPVGAGLAEFALPGLRGGAVYDHDFAIPTSRRGIVPVGPARTVRADPIGLVRRELVWTDSAELVVNLPLLRVAQDLMRAIDGFEARFGFFVPGVLVRVQLTCELSVRLLDFVGRSSSGYSEILVEIDGHGSSANVSRRTRSIKGRAADL